MLYFVSLLLITALAQLFGSAIVLFFIRALSGRLRAMVCVEILLMLAVSLLLIIEGLMITFFVVISALAGMLVLHALNKVIPHRHQTKAERMGLLVFIAMCFHEFPEGIAFGSSYLISPDLGLITAVLIALHNLPEGSIVSVPYFMRGKISSGFKAVLVTQLLYVIGGLVAYFLLAGVSQEFQAMAMAFAAGAMIYVIIEEFLWIVK